MAQMKIFNYPDSCTAKGVGQRMFIRGESTFSIDASRKQRSHPFLTGSDIDWSSGSSTTLYFCRGLPDTNIYAWRIEEDQIAPVTSIPVDVVTREKWRVVGDKISCNLGTFRKAQLVVSDIHGTKINEFSFSGMVLFQDSEIIVRQVGRTSEFIAMDYAGQERWKYFADNAEIIYVTKLEGKSLFSVSYESEATKVCYVELVDIITGKKLLSFEAASIIRTVFVESNKSYFYCSKAVYIVDLTELSLVKCVDFKESPHTDLCMVDKYFVASLEEQSKLRIYDLDFNTFNEFDVIAEDLAPVLLKKYNDNSVAIVFSASDPNNGRGIQKIGLFDFYELLENQSIEIEIEPYFYKVREVEDVLANGISLEITFDQHLSFDDLYRHAAVAIQHNGFIHGKDSTGLNEGKGYNESFTGKIFVDFTGYKLDGEQKGYIEDLCQRSADVLASMPVTAADGKTPIVVVSVIPS